LFLREALISKSIEISILIFFNFYWMLGKAKPTIKIGGSKVLLCDSSIFIGCCSKEQPTIKIG
jgi:hypothetical protein